MADLEKLKNKFDSNLWTLNKFGNKLLNEQLPALQEFVNKMVELQRQIDEQRSKLDKDRKALSTVIDADPDSNIVQSHISRSDQVDEAVDPNKAIVSNPSQPEPQLPEPQLQIVLPGDVHHRLHVYMAEMKAKLRTLIQDRGFLNSYITTPYLPSAIDSFIDFVIVHNKIDKYFPHIKLYTEHPEYVVKIKEAVPYFVKAIHDQEIVLKKIGEQ